MNSQNLNSSAIVTVQMTVEEYLEREAQKTQQQEPAKSRNLVYGLKGIQHLFDCKTTTAWRIKNSEWIKPAITQVGRKIVVDADLALELAHQNTKRVTYNK
ncbi:MAG: DUF3853 family protein [Bacteroidales bacterium]|nr:DUF3853 family protein [Bacteroidales bacterium]